MATRRVKRTKKQLHHGRRKPTRRRYTRRQRGGMLKSIMKYLGTKIITKKGDPLYDGIEVFSTSDNAFHIGNRSLDEYDKSSDPNDRVYADKIRFYLDKAGYHHGNDMIVLNKSFFQAFVDAIATFKFVPTAASAAVAPAASAASAAAGPDDDDDDENKAEFKKMNVNELRATEQIIAFKNNTGDVVHYPADKSISEYKFGNFTIPTSSDGPISGMLKVTFGMGDDRKRTDFTLELRMSSITPALLACMQKIKHVFVNINSITSSSSLFSNKKLIITGTLDEHPQGKNISTYDLNGFVQNFMETYNSCMDPATQLADLRVAGPADLIIKIRAKIVMLNGRVMSAENAHKFVELQRGLLRANNDMEVLKQIDREMDALLNDTRHDPRRPPPSVPVTGRAVPPPSVPLGSFGDASAPPPYGGGKTRRKHRR